MTLPGLGYARYAELGGSLDAAEFHASLRAGLAAVREAVGLNEPEDDEELEAYERAVCAAVEVDAAHGATGGAGEDMVGVTVGGFSASFGSASAGAYQQSAYERDMRRAIRRELSGTGLLYAGLS